MRICISIDPGQHCAFSNQNNKVCLLLCDRFEPWLSCPTGSVPASVSGQVQWISFGSAVMTEHQVIFHLYTIIRSGKKTNRKKDIQECLGCEYIYLYLVEWQRQKINNVKKETPTTLNEMEGPSTSSSCKQISSGSDTEKEDPPRKKTKKVKASDNHNLDEAPSTSNYSKRKQGPSCEIPEFSGKKLKDAVMEIRKSNSWKKLCDQAQQGLIPNKIPDDTVDTCQLEQLVNRETRRSKLTLQNKQSLCTLIAAKLAEDQRASSSSEEDQSCSDEVDEDQDSDIIPPSISRTDWSTDEKDLIATLFASEICRRKVTFLDVRKKNSKVKRIA